MRPGPDPGCPGRSGALGPSRQCSPCPTLDPAGPRRAPGSAGEEFAAGERPESRGAAAQEPSFGGVRRGCSELAGADTPPRWAPRSGGEREKRRRAPQGASTRRTAEAGREGQRGALLRAPRRGSRLSRYKSSSRKIPRGVPAAEGWGSDPRGHAPACRPRTWCVSVPGSRL